MAVNQLKAGAALSYVIIIANIVIGILYTPFVLSRLGQAEFGLYSLATSIIAYLTLLDLGFSNAIIRYTAKFRAEGREREQSEMLGMFVRLYLLIGLVALCIGGALTLNVDALFGAAMSGDEVDKMRIILMLVSLNLAFTFPLSIFPSIITAYENFVFQKVVNLVRVVLNPLTIIVLLIFGCKSIALVAATTLFNLATLLVNWWYCSKRLKIKILYRRFNMSLLKEVGSYSFWIFLGVVMDRIYWSSGQFVLGVYQGSAAVALYAVAIQLQQLYMMFSTAISGVFLPKVTAMVAQGDDHKQISDLFIKTGRVQYIIMAFILTGFILLGRPFVSLWAGAEYDQAYVITLLLFIPLTVPLIQNLGISILQARNQLKFRSITYVSIAVLSLVLSICLAQKYGALGCAIATASALFVGQVVVMNIYYKCAVAIDIGSFWWQILKMSLAPAVVLIVGGYLLRGLDIQSIGSFVVACVIFAIVYIPIFWIFSMNSYERELLRSPLVKLLKFRMR